MKNKAIIVILICAAATMAVISFYYLTPRALVGATASNGNAPSQSLQHSPLSAQVGSDHKPTDLTESGKAAMESFLKNWNPIGRTPDDLKALFGVPKEESHDFLLYSFDNGSYASLYQFEIRHGRVTELLRPKSE
jgi:hypothetical protein